MPTENAEAARERFLNQLHNAQLDMADQGGFLSYWQQVEAEARDSENLGQLDKWVKDLARDKDRVAELRARQQQAASSQMGAAEALQLIQRILALLDDIYIKLRRRLNNLRDRVAWWVFLVGPGKKSKPAPGLDDKKPEKKKKKEDEVRKTNLAKDAKKKQVKKTKAG